VSNKLFNYLQGSDRQWAADRGFAKSEFAVRVNGGKRFGGPLWQKIKCGDGTYGFPMRRQGDPVKMTVGLDGQHKAIRKTLVRSKSKRATATNHPRRVDGSLCGLVSNVEITLAACNPVEVVEKEVRDKKFKRSKNRNPRARRGHKRSRS